MTPLAGTAALLRLAVRRDRTQLPVWLLGLTAVGAARGAGGGGP